MIRRYDLVRHHQEFVYSDKMHYLIILTPTEKVKQIDRDGALCRDKFNLCSQRLPEGISESVFCENKLFFDIEIAIGLCYNIIYLYGRRGVILAVPPDYFPERSVCCTGVYKIAAVLMALVLLVMVFPAAASATGSNSTAETTTTSYVISTSPSESLGSVTFKSSNSTRVEVGKSTTLYITIKDMSGSQATTFSCSNTSVASIEKINNTCVRVYGLKDGEVVISATVGGKTAKYSLVVGSKTASATGGAQGNVTQSGGYNDIDVEFSNLGQDQLSQFIEQNKQDDAATIIMGIISWAAIITLFGVVLSVIFRNRTPKMNMYPGSRTRFNTGSSTGKQKKRLLPDHYYRSIRKY